LFRLDTSLEVKIPTASVEEYLGTGEWDYRIGFAGEYRFWSATTYGGVGWNRLGDPAWIDFNDVIDVVAGVDSDPLIRGRHSASECRRRAGFAGDCSAERA